MKIREFISAIDRKAVFAAGFLLPIALLFSISLLNWLNAQKSISTNKASGLAATRDMEWDPVHLWQVQPMLLSVASERHPRRGITSMIKIASQDADKSPSSEIPRKIAHTGTIWLSVNDPLRALDQMVAIGQEFQGYVVNSQNQLRVVSGEEASLTVRVPADRFDAFRERIKAIAVRVDEENIEAKDVTKEYFDFDARLHSLHSQEEQYLQILKTAHTVEDTLNVTEHLNEVRSQIEQTQGEFNYLQKTVETSVLEIHLQSIPGGKFAALGWRPVQRVKLEFRDGLESLGDYTGSMFAFLMHLPAILLWIATVLFFAVMSWRILRFIWRRFLTQKQVAPGNA